MPLLVARTNDGLPLRQKALAAQSGYWDELPTQALDLA
jgi:hypothetical protein